MALALLLAGCGAGQGANGSGSSSDGGHDGSVEVDGSREDDDDDGASRAGPDAAMPADAGVFPVCAIGDLRAALAAAAPGATVVLRQGCRAEGPLVVPPGVTLAGEGPTSEVDGGDTGAAIEFAEGTGATVRDLRVNVLGGGWAMRAAGDGDATMERVSVHIARGAGVALRGRERVVMRSVKIDGPMFEAAAASAPTTSAGTGTWAVVAVDVGDLAAPGASGVRVEDLDISGLAVGGLSVERSVLEVIDTDVEPDADDVRGIVVSAFESDVRVRGVRITDLFAGNGVPAIAVSAVSSPRVEIADLRVENGAGYGVFADRSAVAIDGVIASGLGAPAVQVQGGSLVARALDLEGGDGAGVVAIDAERVEVRGSTVARQVRAPVPSTSGTVELGDGVLVRRASGTAPMPAIVLADVALDDNARAGLLVDLGGAAPASVSLTNVRARAAGSALGVVSQRAVMPAGWDAAVIREGAALTNDGVFGGGIDVAGIIMPPAIAWRPSL
ncbi:hypothetical protein DB32_004620 [Sandaracinus amylolyticus]|uniref:Right handed beta helix domain-containing protein n=1 Tax=Sandaracinus amylolyticus TaxID=927083 RepID=A0A0F6W521_9BACT|nr:hypothetical protein DB32_004620 [Sandaracinus amylolyticus]